MLILPAEADEAMVSTATGRIEKVAARHSGQVHGVDRWGRRRFAYEVRHRWEGYYILLEASAEPEVMQELHRTLSLADEVVRHKVVRIPDVAVKVAPAAAPAAEV